MRVDPLVSAHEAEGRARRALREVCRFLDERGLIVATDGNVSVRLDDGDLLITPAGRCKRTLSPLDMVRTDPEGKPRGASRPSSEIGLHLAIYRHRPDARAIIHAHPPVAIAHTVAGVSLADPLMPEALVELGRVPTLPLVQPGTEAMGQQLELPVQEHDVMMLERHGSVTLGPNLRVALTRLEFLEQAAKVSFHARLLAAGPVEALPEGLQSALTSSPSAPASSDANRS
ncbi:MAG: class II aldolase/adducin family protein [Myxococcota bacterium]